jgi:23S rRNA pseudouridine1911/1915/1917 synthase
MRRKPGRPPKPAPSKGEQHVVAEAGTLESAMLAFMPGASKRTLKQAIEHGRVRVDGKPARRLDAPVRVGATVELAPRGRVAAADAQKLPPGLTIIYSDDDILVVEKPAGMLTIATENEKQRTVYARLRQYVKADDPHAKIFIVHRLDRPTSGVLVFARHPEAKETLQTAFAERRVERVYTAVVAGRVREDEGELRSWLVEDAIHKVHVTDNRDRGVEAVTRFRVVKRGDHYTLVKISLVTGRKAQIRVQFAEAGHPVVGDREYGGATDVLGRLALHAMILSFDHPATGRRMTFTSSPPRDFAALVAEK